MAEHASRTFNDYFYIIADIVRDPEDFCERHPSLLLCQIV
jgi:hypothetical protein